MTGGRSVGSVAEVKMNVVQGSAAVFSNKEKDELTIVMDGFRIALTGNEARALSSALSQGLSELNNHNTERPSLAPRDASRPAYHNAMQTPFGATRQASERVGTTTKRDREPGSGHGDEPRSVQTRMLEATNAGVIVIDPFEADNPIVFANAAAATMTGYGVSELVGQSSLVLFGPTSDAKVVESVRRAFANQQAMTATVTCYRKDGTPFWVKLGISPVRGADGKLAGFIGAFFDISEQKQIEQEARRARAAAERANQAKSEFIAGISHDVRTALTGLIGFTNLLLSENLTAEQRRYATLAREAGNSLLAVINNVLDLSKIEAGKLELAESDFGVIELAVSCHAAVWQAAREKGLDLNFVLKPDVPNMVRGDPDRIRRVLLNLLTNAIKFTEKGNVVLSLSRAEEGTDSNVLRFSVTDTGVGIAKEKQDLLFRQFSQIEGSASQASTGTGLGLAISKTLVQQMGGTIGVTSTPGVGSQFWFTLPFKPPAGAGAKQASGIPLQRARVLIAEDTPINQELMVTLLKKAGHEVELVTNGEAAVEAVRRTPFDLVLMDLQLPRMDGFGATRAIRALEGKIGEIPIIALTARASSKDVEECLAAGMNDHLPKPIDALALLSTVDRWTKVARPAGARTRRPETDHTPIHDEAMLRDLESHLGREKVASMVAMAGEDIPRRLDRIYRRLADPEFGGQQAHELVSIAGNLGFTELVARSRRFIEVCNEGDGEGVRAAYHDLKAAGDRAISVMRGISQGFLGR
jgi:PAS domain S-box-containing protein